MSKGQLVANLAGAAGMTLYGPALVDNYPARPLKLIILFPPGGTIDIIGCNMADQLPRVLGQAVVTENKGDGGGSISADAIVKAASDDYTIDITTVSAYIVNPACSPKPSCDPLKDFKPTTNLATVANVTTVNPTFPAKNYKEFVATLATNPGKYSFVISGTCGIGHMLGETSKVLTKTQMVRVLYRGTGLVLNDVLANQVSIVVDNLSSSMQFIKSDKLRPIAVAWNKRIDSPPDVLTFAEAGLKDVNNPAWYGLVAPVGTPDEVIHRPNEASIKALREPGLVDRFHGTGVGPAGNTPRQYTAEIKHESEKIRTLVKQQNIKLEQ